MVAQWEKVVEEGQEFWVNEELGNVVKTGKETYVALMPKVLRFGPFNSSEEAQQFIEEASKKLDSVLAGVSDTLTTK